MKFKVTKVYIHGEKYGWYLEDEQFSEKDCMQGEQIIGEVELDVKPVKKWVKKEVCGFLIARDATLVRTGDCVPLPHHARNVAISYEVEE